MKRKICPLCNKPIEKGLYNGKPKTDEPVCLNCFKKISRENFENMLKEKNNRANSNKNDKS